MIKSDRFRGAVFSKFKSEKEFADAINWSKQHFNSAMVHPERLTLEQTQIMLDALGITEFPGIDFFVPTES